MMQGKLTPEELVYFEKKGRRYTDMIRIYGIPYADPAVSGELYQYPLESGGILQLLFSLGKLIDATIRVEANGRVQMERVDKKKRYLRLLMPENPL